MKELWAIQSEWDLGHEGALFENYEDAEQEAKRLWHIQNMNEEVGMTFFEANEQNLISVVKGGEIWE